MNRCLKFGNRVFPPTSKIVLYSRACSTSENCETLCIVASAIPACFIPISDGLKSSSGIAIRSLLSVNSCASGGSCVSFS